MGSMWDAPVWWWFASPAASPAGADLASQSDAGQRVGIPRFPSRTLNKKGTLFPTIRF